MGRAIAIIMAAIGLAAIGAPAMAGPQTGAVDARSSVSTAIRKPVGQLKAARSAQRADTLLLNWNGPVGAPMADQIGRVLAANKADTRRVVLQLSSGGGSVKEGEKVIAMLQELKKTHTLVTTVKAGQRCGSMCVFIYVQGQKRFAAPASLWLFHEVSFRDAKTGAVKRLDRGAWERLVQKYWVPAGLSPGWIADVRAHTHATDFWQAGSELIAANAGLIHKPLSNENKRRVGKQPS